MKFFCIALHATVFLARQLGVVDAYSCEGGPPLQCMDVHALENAPAWHSRGTYAEADSHTMCNAEGKQVSCLSLNDPCTAVGQAQCCEGNIRAEIVDPNSRTLPNGRRLPNEQLVCTPASAPRTDAPTAVPSQAPTAVPTSAPPTDTPTAVPTDAPTAAPTPLDITKYGKKGVLTVTMQGKFAESKHGDAYRNVGDNLDLKTVLVGHFSVFESVLKAQFHVHRVDVWNIEVDYAGRRLSDSDSFNGTYKVHFFAYGEPSLGALRRTDIADSLQEVFSTEGVEVIILSTWLNIDTEMSKRDDIDDSRIQLPPSELDEENDQNQFAARAQLQTGSDKEDPKLESDDKDDGLITFAVSMCAAIISALGACLCACCILKCRAAKKSDATNNKDVENNNTEIAKAYGKFAEQNANSEEVAGEVLRPASSPSSPASIDIGDASKPKSGQTNDDETNSVSTAAPASEIGGANLERPSWHSDEASQP